MASEGSITGWYNSLQEGNRGAAQQLWERFAQRLIRLARFRLQPNLRHATDEEDVALSAFDSFCRAAEQARFPQLQDRDGLWQLLVTITLRKIYDQLEYEQAQKRGGGRVLREADVGGAAVNLEAIMSQEPSPEMAAELSEQCQRLLGQLEGDQLRAIALLRMEGYTDHEIAARLGCARSTVQRRLRLIRQQWETE